MNYLNENINLGGCLELKGDKIEVEIEKENFISVAYAFDNNNEIELTQTLEKSVLKIIEQLDSSILKIHIIDFNVTRKYQYLNKLKHIENLINYVNLDNIKSTLNEIEKIVIDYNNNYITDELLNICQYNRLNTGYQLKYNIIILNFDYLNINNEHYIALNKLLKHGRKSGILFFFQFNNASFANEIILNRKKQSYSNKNKIDFYELVLNKSIAIYKVRNHYVIQNASNELKKVSKWFNPICDNIESILNSIKETERNTVKNTVKNNFLSVQIGKKGKQIFNFELGLKSTSYHAFIGGQTGMGKSNFINNIIVQIAEKYSSDDIRLVLLDLNGSGGTEFQFYKEHSNVETLVLTSKLDIVEKVIADFTDELNIRTKLFLDKEVKNIEEYRKKNILPYKVMIIDEVQELFRLHRTSALFNTFLDKIGRLGRKYGIHMVLSTQSLDNVDIDKSILNTLNLRIAFKLASTIDCWKIMDNESNNNLPYNIEPYEVVYNNNLGKLGSNQHFMTTEIKTDTIIKRINNSKHNAVLTFKRKIYYSDTNIKKNENPKINNNNQILKDELNIDEFL